MFVKEPTGIHRSQAVCTCPTVVFFPSPPAAALFPFLAKYLRPAQGKSSGFWRPVSGRQECLGTQGFPLGKQMFLQQLKFCKELPPGLRGAGVSKASGVISNACPSHPPPLFWE